MAFSGGTFSRTFDCTTDRDNGVKILASKFDTELDGMATGLSTCILKDGTQTCTAAIPFAQGITLPDNKTIILGTNSDVTIQYDETTNDSLEIAANVEGAALGIVLKADQGDDNADQHKVNVADGGTLTMASKISGSFVSYLTHTPNSTVASSTTAVAGNLTVGGDLTLGSGAVITEAELEMLDGITAGTVSATKAMVVDANKDITGGRNLTISGELDAATLDISGDVDIDGTLETDALSIASTAVTATAAELNILDGVTSTAAELNILDGVTATTAELNYSDTGAAVGTVVASKVVTADANKDVASFRNITLTGELDAGSLDVSGDADIDGTLEADAMTLNGTAITATATLDTGISNNNVPKFTSGVADDDFLRVAGTAIEGRSAAEVLSDIGASAVAGSSSIVTTGALNAGSITSGFGAIDNGSSAITTTGVITGGTLEATTDTAAGDNAAIGYTSAEGLILTGQGSTNDVTIKNDADADVLEIPTGTTNVTVVGNMTAGGTVSGADALSHRSMVINGAMNVAQRSASVTGLGSAAGYFTVDRWSIGINGTTAGRFTMSQSTDAPAGFSKSIKLDVTTADTSIAAGEAVGFLQRIEGQDIQRLSKGTSDAKTAVFSFYAKGTAKTFIVEFQDDNSRRFSRTFTTTTSWQRFEIGVPADTTGEIDDDNTAGLTIIFWFHAGSDFTSGTLQTTWGGTTSANRMVGCESLFSSTDNELFITGAQLELGEVATPFEHRSFADDLAACQRYYYQIKSPTTYTRYAMSAYDTATDYSAIIPFPIEMRSTPTLSTTGTASNYSIYALNSNKASNAVPSLTAGSPFNVCVQGATASSTAGAAGVLLDNNAAGTFLGFSAEL
jgi:cytoskeletal protein CcmA (bactofilin family)